jgi:hypothetical protein
MRKLDFSEAEWTEIREHAHNHNGMTVTEYLRAGHDKMKAAGRAPARAPRVIRAAKRQRTMYECSVKDCGFHTAIERACPRHPSAKLKRLA